MFVLDHSIKIILLFGHINYVSDFYVLWFVISNWNLLVIFVTLILHLYPERLILILTYTSCMPFMSKFICVLFDVDSRFLVDIGHVS